MTLLTAKEVAVALSASERHVYRLIAAGDLPHVLVGKRAVRVSSDALSAFLEGRTFRGARTAK